MEWNAAKGRAESVHLDRWDGIEQPTQTVPPAENSTTPPATSSLKRWDSP
jgi:hypothetical protein